ncbi:MAG: hypothetical protein AAF840_06340 [Bacteroidota bacterium]
MYELIDFLAPPEVRYRSSGSRKSFDDYARTQVQGKGVKKKGGKGVREDLGAFR